MKSKSILYVASISTVFLMASKGVAQNFPSSSQLQQIRQQFPSNQFETLQKNPAEKLDTYDPSKLKINWGEGLYSLESEAMKNYLVGNYREAAPQFATLIDSDPENARYLELYGQSLLFTNENEQAIAALSKAINLDPKNPKHYLWRGLAHRNLRKGNRAIQDFNQALSLDPKDPAIYLERGQLYRMANLREKAVADFTQGIELDKSRGDAFFFRGATLAELNQRQQAIADMEQSIQLLKDANQLQKMQYISEVLEDYKASSELKLKR